MNLPQRRATAAVATSAKPSKTKGALSSTIHPDAAVPPLDVPCELLGGLSPSAFMDRHWQRKPLLVRQALPGIEPPVARAQLFAMLEDDSVESRLLSRQGEGDAQTWQFKRGPMPRRSLPTIKQAGWTVLVQGLNLHVPAAAALLNRFRFVPQARIDDLMISWASEGGGVGPHFDSYDVFLIQVQGRRRWRIGRMADARLKAGLPVKIIENFRYEEEWVLEPGDMLYLPPGWAHDGDAVDGECMTCSVGFRSPQRSELVRETLLRLADGIDDPADAGARPPVYRDPKQPATITPGRIPAELLAFAEQALKRALTDPAALARALGEYLSEPKAQVSFELGEPLPDGVGVQLDSRSCLLYDEGHVYCNGDSWRAAGRDAAALQTLADARQLDAAAVGRASPALRDLLAQWVDDGWLHPLAA
jgi:50S ribosomal protein L16 3-hydroxylase